jgi:hypothetical protein
MTNLEAYRLLHRRLAECSEAQARDIRDLLRMGAGDLGLPEGAVATEPAELPPERRPHWFSLVDGIRYLGGAGEGGDDREFRPVHGGSWEPVIATLVIEGDWDRIRAAADDLRRDRIQRARDIIYETRDVCGDARLYEARMLLEDLL